jgi:hypothetical protein
LPDLRRIVNDVQKFSVTGTLKIKDEVSTDFVQKIFKDIVNRKDVASIRKEIISNEKSFSNDYRQFLKELFEIIFNSDLEQETKANCLLIVAKSMETDAFVVDKEINCFSALINLSRNILQ